jgi:hypothetical protein
MPTLPVFDLTLKPKPMHALRLSGQKPGPSATHSISSGRKLTLDYTRNVLKGED